MLCGRAIPRRCLASWDRACKRPCRSAARRQVEWRLKECGLHPPLPRWSTGQAGSSESLTDSIRSVSKLSNGRLGPSRRCSRRPVGPSSWSRSVERIGCSGRSWRRPSASHRDTGSSGQAIWRSADVPGRPRSAARCGKGAGRRGRSRFSRSGPNRPARRPERKRRSRLGALSKALSREVALMSSCGGKTAGPYIRIPVASAGMSGARSAGLPLASQSDFLGQPRSRFGVFRSHHRVILGKSPFGAIFIRRHAMKAQMPLKGLEL